MVSCDALVRSGVPVLPGLTTVPQNEEPDIFACAIDPDGTADGLPGGVEKREPFAQTDRQVSK